jgi:hypothetical protein
VFVPTQDPRTQAQRLARYMRELLVTRCVLVAPHTEEGLSAFYPSEHEEDRL